MASFEGDLFFNAVGLAVVWEIKDGFAVQSKSFVIYKILFFFISISILLRAGIFALHNVILSV